MPTLSRAKCRDAPRPMARALVWLLNCQDAVGDRVALSIFSHWAGSVLVPSREPAWKRYKVNDLASVSQKNNSITVADITCDAQCLLTLCCICS